MSNDAQPPAADAPAAAPAAATTHGPISSTIETAAGKVMEFLEPYIDKAKANLPADVVERIEGAMTQAGEFSHKMLERADGAAASISTAVSSAGDSVRKAPEAVMSRVAGAQEAVQARAAEGSDYVKNALAGLPSFADLKTMGAEQLDGLSTAVMKLRESLPASLPELKLPEDQVVKVRGAVGKVLEALPKVPSFELPKVDLSAFSPQEIVKLGHSLLDRLAPLIAPYQDRLTQLLGDLKVPERAAAIREQAAEYYKKYELEKVAPAFVSSFVNGEAAKPAEDAANPAEAAAEPAEPAAQ